MEEIKGFIYLRTSTYTCGKMTNTVKEYANFATNMEFVLIPGGSFMMGSDSHANENPIHQVTLSLYLISKTTVTQGVWQRIMGENPSYFQKGKHYPVECVSWEDCQIFCQKTGLQLPTEAQWEYACRGGDNRSKWCYGDDESKLSEYAWYDGNSGSTTHRVGKKKANGLGLYDMHGNVWEWCRDVYSSDFYRSSPEKDPIYEEKNGSDRVYRGGSWINIADYTRLAYRGWNEPDARYYNLGFRVISVKP